MFLKEKLNRGHQPGLQRDSLPQSQPGSATSPSAGSLLWPTLSFPGALSGACAGPSRKAAPPLPLGQELQGCSAPRALAWALRSCPATLAEDWPATEPLAR